MRTKRRISLIVTLCMITMLAIVALATVRDEFNSTDGMTDAYLDADVSWHWLSSDDAEGYMKITANRSAESRYSMVSVYGYDSDNTVVGFQSGYGYGDATADLSVGASYFKFRAFIKKGSPYGLGVGSSNWITIS